MFSEITLSKLLPNNQGTNELKHKYAIKLMGWTVSPCYKPAPRCDVEQNEMIFGFKHRLGLDGVQILSV